MLWYSKKYVIIYLHENNNFFFSFHKHTAIVAKQCKNSVKLTVTHVS